MSQDREVKARIIDLLQQRDLCALATNGPDGPHCSLMTYLAHKNGERLYLITSQNTRKFRNIMDNPLVSILVDDREVGDRRGNRALTMHGLCHQVENAERTGRLLEAFAQRHPHLCAILADPAFSLLEVEITSFQLFEGPTVCSNWSPE